MNHDEIVALIQPAITPTNGTWADFGAGSGAFTHALREVLDQDAQLFAIDRDAKALRSIQPPIQTIQADFTKTLELPALDGALSANALHWVRSQIAVLKHLSGFLRPGAPFIIIEYDVKRPRPYIPYPLGVSRLHSIAKQAGFKNIETIHHRKSPSSGISMVVTRLIAPEI